MTLHDRINNFILKQEKKNTWTSGKRKSSYIDKVTLPSGGTRYIYSKGKDSPQGKYYRSMKEAGQQESDRYKDFETKRSYLKDYYQRNRDKQIERAKRSQKTRKKIAQQNELFDVNKEKNDNKNKT